MTIPPKDSQVVATTPPPPTETPDLNLLNQQANQVEAKMKAEGIEEIKYINGPHATYDPKTNKTVVSGGNAIVHKTENTTTIQIINPGVDPKKALPELHNAGNTQKQIGAATDSSQQQVSVDLNTSK
ncbi:hypothetical protein H1X88_22855 [Vibrio parahaemolyticus]|uniref:hypothetical protein n=1 Tax=Vibrio parahaemolyticus TaxID=670 RepID=UPI0016550496|nr:hypothetical protein [Vibrio parahaemolyticus]MBC8659594.1 hypothetical protein [Vibrio parahaemolyticus]